MNPRVRPALLLCLLGLATPMASHAVCFEPGTERSGYVRPLSDEVAAVDWIVVGRVISQSARLDPAAPDGIGHFVFRVELVRTLKGAPPHVIEIESAADSGGYRVEVGETHLLFVQSATKPRVDACGNSDVIAKSRATLQATEHLLANSAAKPL